VVSAAIVPDVDVNAAISPQFPSVVGGVMGMVVNRFSQKNPGVWPSRSASTGQSLQIVPLNAADVLLPAN
jgi:hypothetical protein